MTKAAPKIAAAPKRKPAKAKRTLSKFVQLDDGCFGDQRLIWKADDGSAYTLEWTPTLNAHEDPGNHLTKAIENCTLAGGGWQVPTRAELLTLVDTDNEYPATFAELKEDTRSGWYITSSKCAWSSGRVWFVYFGHGDVLLVLPDGGGFARGVRRVPVLPGQ